MRRRRLLLGVSAVVLLVAGFALFVWLTRPTPGVTWENFRRLHIGMSVKEVERLLGEPHEVYGSRRGTERYWKSQEVEISLTFDTEGLYDGRGHSPPTDNANWSEHLRLAFDEGERIRTHEGFLDHIRRWLPW